MRPSAFIVAVLLLIVSIEAKTAKEICSSPTCKRAGGSDDISMEQALLLAPCVGGDLSCFGYGSNGACPFAGQVDCSKEILATTTSPAPTTTVKPTTSTPKVTTIVPSSDKSEESSEGVGSWPFVIAGGAIALAAIGWLVFHLIRKSAKRNQEDDEIDAVEYAKPIPVSTKGDMPPNNSSFGYNDRGNKSFVDPMRQNKSFVQAHDIRRQNTGSFIQNVDPRSGLVKNFNETSHAPIARPNTASFLQNNAPPNQPAPYVHQPAYESKEQFYVPDSAGEKSFPDARDNNRRESFEF